MPNPRGQPTTCTDEMKAKAREYVDGAWNHGTDVIPSHIGLAKYIGIPRRTIYQWRETEKKDGTAEFSHILEECMLEQENELINKGLIGSFNSNIVKLALGKHGYSDKQDINAPEGITINIDPKDADNG